jgi:G patch domain-containing protein 1
MVGYTIDDSDYTFYGSKILDQNEFPGYKKAPQDAASTRALPTHKQVCARKRDHLLTPNFLFSHTDRQFLPLLTASSPLPSPSKNTQEVTDDQGRRRFHGAFTGGYSAGYFNTVGSAEGWAPSTFVSSRSSRAAPISQDIDAFLDDDERQERNNYKLRTTATYDTFGYECKEAARRAVAAENQASAASARHGAIAGLVPEELFVAAVPTSIGMQLLQRMGWKEGKGIGLKDIERLVGEHQEEEGEEEEEEDVHHHHGHIAKKRKRPHRQATTVAVAAANKDNTPLYLIQPKLDQHGLGYDPFQGAEEFRAAARQEKKEQHQQGVAGVGVHSTKHTSTIADTTAKRSRGVAFGVGAVEEDDDTYGMMEDDEDNGGDNYVAAAAAAAGGGGGGGGGDGGGGVVSLRGGLDPKTGLPYSRVGRIEKSGLGDRLALQGYDYEIQDEKDEEEEEEEVEGGKMWERPLLLLTHGNKAPVLALQSKEEMQGSSNSVIPGFVKAQHILHLKYFPPPPIPTHYKPNPSRILSKAFFLNSGSGGTGGREGNGSDVQGATAPTSLPPQAPPEDPELRKAIDSLAFYVARDGQKVEDTARIGQKQQQQQPAGHCFLLGGPGSQYYHWKVYSLQKLILGHGSGHVGGTTREVEKKEERVKPWSLSDKVLQRYYNNSTNRMRRYGGGSSLIAQRSAPLTADERGHILGEAKLPNTSEIGGRREVSILKPSSLDTGEGKEKKIEEKGQTGTLARSLLNVAEADRVKLQALLGQTFVKASTEEEGSKGTFTKTGGGLFHPPLTGATGKTAAAVVPKVITAADLSKQLHTHSSATAVSEGGNEQEELKIGQARRTLEEWRPTALLCKRLGVADPYHGCPAEIQMSKFKTDYIALPETAANTATAVIKTGNKAMPPPPSRSTGEREKQQEIDSPHVPPPLPEARGSNDDDVQQAADDFLAALAGELMVGSYDGHITGYGGDDNGREELQVHKSEAASPASAVGRPMDLFKAIFEESNSEDDEEEGVGDGIISAPPPIDRDKMTMRDPGRDQEQGNDKDFGFAKLRHGIGGGGGEGTKDERKPPPPPPGGGGDIGEATKRRVEVALKALKRHKRDRKRSKDKKEKEKKKKKKRSSHKYASSSSGRKKKKKKKKRKRRHNDTVSDSLESTSSDATSD